MKKVFITGGAGYIGSHLCELLMRKNFKVRVYDNFSTSSHFNLQSISSLHSTKVDLVLGDIMDMHTLGSAMQDFQPDIVVHLAGLKSVTESISHPNLYHTVNSEGTQRVLEAMDRANCHHIVFSSSATVYGRTGDYPVTEEHICKPISPYGKSKLKGEEFIMKWVNLKQSRSAICLRYFNPVGAHSSGVIGEDLQIGAPNLMNIISKVALGEIEYLPIYGTDYSTQDGTAERDYIHILDLVEGHEAAIEKCLESDDFYIYNLGTGTSVSVKRLVHRFQAVSQVKIPCKSECRRQGDAVISCANVELARKELSWSAKRNVKDMCVTQWNWLHNGYQTINKS